MIWGLNLKGFFRDLFYAESSLKYLRRSMGVYAIDLPLKVSFSFSIVFIVFDLLFCFTLFFV